MKTSAKRFSLSVFSKVIFITILALLFASCESYVTFENTSADPYMLYLDGKELGSIGPHDKVTKGVTEGYHTFKAKQISGYFLYPTVKESSGKLESGKSYNFFFP